MTDYTSYKVATLVGTTILPSLVYGMNSTLIFMAFRLLWKGRTADTRTRKRALLMTTYVALLCALCTAHWALSCVEGALSLVKSTLPSNKFKLKLGKEIPPVIIIAFDSIYLALTCMADGLLLWRCWVLYAGCSTRLCWFTRILFLILFLCLIATGISISQTMETLSYDGSLVLPSLVLAMNAIFAALIVGRLIYHQRKLGARSSSQYTSIATMIIESAGLNIVFQTLALGSTKNIVLNSLFNFNLLGQIQVFATLLIIFRVAQGRARAEHASHEMTQIRFGPWQRTSLAEDGPRWGTLAEPGRLGIIEDKDEL